jgi:flavodoxin/NAD-dependent dihydropyrimidine dehydrogenase PreA subunit
MSKSLIVYFSQGGTTAKVAESIAAGLRSEKCEVEQHNMKDKPQPGVSDYDMLGIGSPVYFYRPPFIVNDYLNSLPDLGGLPTFTFLLCGTYAFNTGKSIRRGLASKGAKDIGHFRCYGADFFLPYLREGYLFSPGHPSPEELSLAEAFGREVAHRASGQPCSPVEDDRPPKPVYRLERFFLNRRFVEQAYSRLFRVDKKSCNACGLCLKTCPCANIGEDKDGYPVWGRNCLLCLTCELKCPQEAITSPVSWPLMRPFMIYNVYSASRDPSLDYVRVTHSKGRTRRL